MEPVQIAILGADETELRAECNRLGIKAGHRASAVTMRKRLRHYTQTRMLHERWLNLAELLFTPEYRINSSTLDDLVNGVHARLYIRLAGMGLVSSEDGKFSLLRDPGNNRLFAITGRKSTCVLHTLIFPEKNKTASYTGTCTTLYAARIAFKDVNDALTVWEAKKKEE